jgi:glycosyltransferase involved in cell wall biosynthesis
MREPERQPRIAFFTEASPDTRASSFRLAEELARFASIAVSIPEASSDTEEEKAGSPGIEIRPRPAYGGTMARYVMRLPILLVPTWRAIVRAVDGADLVLSRIPSPIVGLVDRAARRKGLPHVLYIVADIEAAADASTRGRPSLARPLKRRAGRWIRRHQQRLAGGRLVVVVGRELASQYRPFARRCECFYPTSVREDQISPRRDTCGSSTVQLLHVGRLVPLKGTSYLLDAVAHLRERSRDVRLTIVGSGPLRGELERARRSLGLEDHVTFVGTLPYGNRLFELYRRADLFVHPSLSESFPRVLWEAMAAHTPIVATDVGSVGDLLRTASAGLTVSPRSSRELADAVARLIDDGELRRKLIAAGGNLIRQHTVEQQGRLLWELLREEIATEPQTPSP